MAVPEFIPIRDKPGWNRAQPATDPNQLEELAKSLNARRPPQTYFVCGLLAGDRDYGLYRIESDDPVEIIKAFEVGSHAAESYGEDAGPKVLEEMAEVHARNPIVPFFADPAGLKCTFERPLMDDFVDFLESHVTEGCEAYADEGYLGPTVLREKCLRLWWD